MTIIHHDIERRVRDLEKYQDDQKVRSAVFGKEFDALKKAVAALEEKFLAHNTPTHEHIR